MCVIKNLDYMPPQTKGRQIKGKWVGTYCQSLTNYLKCSDELQGEHILFHIMKHV